MKSSSGCIAILHNIRSLHNVGSVFRTADGAGVRKIYCTGYTPAPVNEMGRVHSEIAKTALGAECAVAWEKVLNIRHLIKKLKKDNVEIIALEYTHTARDYRGYIPRRAYALVVGNEVRGLSSAILRTADTTIAIPMRGTKESLNVSVAFGIAVYALSGATGMKRSL